MISNLLPGFRNVRTPLATGYLVFVLVWLLTGRPAPTDGTSWLGGALQSVGPIGASTMLAAASVAAYLVGSVLTIDPVVSRTNPTRAISRCLRLAWWCDIRHIYATTEQQLTALVRARTDVARHSGVDIETYRAQVFDGAGDDSIDRYGRWMNHRCWAKRKCTKRVPGKPPGSTAEWIDLEDATVGRLFAEIPILAVQLHAGQKDLFDDYDRALSEAGFRVSVLVPVVLIAFSVGCSEPLPAPWRFVAFAGGLVAFYALWTRAATKVRNANDIVVQALVLGIVESPFLEHLDGLNASAATPPTVLPTHRVDPAAA